MQNLLHIPIGEQFPTTVNSIVEIPKDTNAKYEYNVSLGILELSRCLISSMRYPASYGFVPQTISDDGDPLDIMVYNTVPIQSLALVEVRPIGALHMIDNEIDDYKVLGIPVYNPNNYNKLSDLDPLFLEVVEDFFEHYKNNDRKKKNTVKINGWVDIDFTYNLIRKSHDTYLNRHGKLIIKTDGFGNNKLMLG
jgi:inorganic pyrophosphatase